MNRRNRRVDHRKYSSSRRRHLIFISIIYAAIFAICFYPIYQFFQQYKYYSAKILFTFPHIEDLPITYISVPRPPKNELQEFRYRLIFASWLASSPSSQVLLFADPDKFDIRKKVIPDLEVVFGKGRIHFGGDLPGGYKNKPLIGEWIRRGFAMSKTNMMTFINSDIVIPPTWIQQINRVALTFPNRSFLIMGVRINFKMDYENFIKLNLASPTLLVDAQNKAHQSLIKRFAPAGCDTFTMKKDMPPFNIAAFPNFTLGFCIWDNYLMGQGIKYSTSVTFYTSPAVLHMEHPTNLTCGWNEPHNIPNRDLFFQNNGLSGTSDLAKWRALRDELLDQETAERIPMFPYF